MFDLAKISTRKWPPTTHPKFGGTSQPPHMRTRPHFHERAPEVHIESSGGRQTSGQVRIPAPLAACGQLLGSPLEGVPHTLFLFKSYICHNDNEGLHTVDDDGEAPPVGI